MSSSPNATMGEAELRLLSYIAEHGPSTVREVWDGYGREQGYVRTTVQQMMERLRKKGILSRSEEADGFRYAAAEGKPGLLKGAVGRFVTQSLGGSVSPFVQYLVDAPDLTDEDVKALSELVERLKKEGRE